VFLDRDGTLTEEVGYVNHPKRLRLLPRSAEAIRRLNAAGVPAVVVTNQAGIARGYFTEDVLQAVNDELRAQLSREGAYLDGLYVCTHHPTEGEPPFRMRCECPSPVFSFRPQPTSTSISAAP
jgi:D-glycero-D-manno-heptose 1,7-bisphosphate phosphatase